MRSSMSLSVYTNRYQVALITLIATFATGAAGATWTTLDPPGATFTEPHAIDGSRVVGEYADASGPYQSFLYDGTAWTTLAFPGATYTIAFDIDGTDIVGLYIDASGRQHGFLYDGTTWTTLDYPGASGTSLYGVDAGKIVGNCNTAGGIMYDGTTWSVLSLPESGLTVLGIDGSNIIASRWSHSFVYDGTTWTKLEFPGVASTEAHGIDGSYIVGEYNTQSGAPDHGFIWDGTTWTTLDLPGANGTIIFDIDGARMVGRYLDSSGQFHGFLYSVNQAPVANAGPDQTVEQTSVSGADVVLDGSASSDPEGEPLTYEWTWTGGSASGVNPMVSLPPGETEISLTVSDGELSDTDTVCISIEDTTPPQIFIGAPEPYAIYPAGALTLAFGATDAVGVTELAGTLEESNGSPQPVSPGEIPGVGVYTLVVTANDAAGNIAESEPVFFVVYDAEGGFVTGGGWIDSPPGAYRPDTSLAGRANFGFVSKYKKGATAPEGQTEFVFQAGDLNFHSSSYDWLVVTGSDYAKFKGTGTINGFGAYKFMLWARDGGSTGDTFRIKIWQETNSVEDVVYDNGTDRPISGGSIVVHTK
jgi:hypothetical protein